jgi:hypothetical protein
MSSGPTTDPAPDPRGARLGRRGLLGLATLSALPLGACAPKGTPDSTTSQPATDGGASGSPTASATSAAPTAKPVVTSGGGTVPFTPGKAMLGAYVGLYAKSLGEGLALRRRQLGREQRIVHAFYDWQDTLPQSLPGVSNHSTLLISWRGTYYEEVNDGYWDRQIAAAAKRLAKHGKPLLLRWGWEMNGDWYRWGGDSNGKKTAAYGKVWRRMHRIFADEGASNVSWVWSPNWNSSPDVAWNKYTNYYPGDKYVDWVGVSGYNFGKETPDTLFDGIYETYAAQKPIMVTEVGAVDRGGRTKADWITDFAGWVEARPAVGGVVWFDTDTHPGTSEEFRIDSDPESLAAYRAMARNPRFGG